MAITADGTTQTHRHAAAQAAILAATIRDFAHVWRGFGTGDVATFWPAIEAALRLLIGQRHRESSTQTLDYYRRFRSAERASGALRLEPATALPDDLVAVTLRIAGPVAFKRAIATGATPRQARERAFASASGAGARLALSGGRGAFAATFAADRTALGWARVTDANPCYWCAMLASRGPVYRTRAGAGRAANADFAGAGGYKFHDHCGCVAEPVYGSDSDWPGKARQYRALWDKSTSGLSGKRAIAAFRSAHQGD